MKNKRIIILLVFISIFFIIIISKLSYLQIRDNKASLIELEKLSTKKITGLSAPRGRIFDRNYNVIVDNEEINMLTYKKEKGVSTKDEVKISYEIANNIDLPYSKLTKRNLKEFWLINNIEKANSKITDREYELYERRKLKSRDLEEYKIARISDDDLSIYKDIDKKAAYIYYLMHNGYYYDDKIIKEELTSDEVNYINNNKSKLKGFLVIKSWKRSYPYGDTLRQILGNVSYIPQEERSTYLNKGYKLNDRVGISYLEKEYEDELKGKKSTYELKNGVRTLLKDEERGNDIVLSIDMNLQSKLEEIMEEEMLKAKEEPNTNFYNNSSVVITNPKTGEVLAMASKQIMPTSNGYQIRDYTTNILSGSNTPGSIVKGASMLVGYSTGKLNIGDIYYDKCIKFKNTPEKCSWKSLGTLNDITALTYSSNSYQFQLALKVAGINYYPNMPIKITDEPLNIYRNTFNKLGLGSKSGIDLPFETTGYKGKKTDAGLLLNYAIGQYDTYSSLQLSSYINTIANEGNRYKLNLVSEIRNSTNDSSLGSIKFKYSPVLLNKVDIEDKYFKRVNEGFKSVMEGYLGRGYMGKSPNPAGKTGTSESFYDSDNDGVVDKETYTKSFIGYAPYDNPVISISAISPHISFKNGNNKYTSNVNKRISSRICNFFFENLK